MSLLRLLSPYSIRLLRSKLGRFLKSNWFVLTLLVVMLLGIGKRYYKATATQKASPMTSLNQSSPSSTMGVFEGPSHEALPRLSAEEQLAFLKRFSGVAKQEMKKYGIPASVILSTAYVNSFGGTRPMLAKTNNYFSILCGIDKGTGAVQLNGTCYAKFGTAWESYRAFSVYASKQDWVQNLKASHGNYEDWVKAIAQRMYADNPDFEREARTIIHQYRLFELD